MLTKQIIKFFSAILLIFFPLSALALPVDVNFNPSKLIEDSNFSDTQTFGGALGVQKFLQDKNSVLANTSNDFLIKLKEPTSVELKTALLDPNPNLGRLRTAAELIWDASVHSGINPQVIIVTLQKEQSLIEGKFPNQARLQRALDTAMGFACPDSGGCSDLFPGFYYQLFGNYDSSGNRYLGSTKSLMRSFNTPNGRGPNSSKVGDTIELENTLGDYDNILARQSVMLGNKATAALYRYTPHVFNGNYNFWKFFQNWFKYKNGSLLKLANSQDVYIIQNGLKALVPAFVAESRKLDLNSVIIVSPNEISSLSTDKPLGPVDNTLVTVSGETKKYVFINNVKHPASDLVINQRGLGKISPLVISNTDADIYEKGPVLPPKDGTIIRGVKNQAVFMVVDEKIKMFSEFTFKQNKISPKQIVIVPDEEILTYEQSGFVQPKDGSLVKAQNDNTVYYIQNGLKQPVLGEVFKNRGFSIKNIGVISKDELSALALGSFATPKDRTFYAIDSKTGPLYIFKEGTAHSISKFVAKQRGVTPDYIFSQEVGASWPVGIPIPPKDGSLIKGDSDAAVYLVKAGQLNPISAAAFKKRKLNFKNVVTLPQVEVDSYAKGETIN